MLELAGVEPNGDGPDIDVGAGAPNKPVPAADDPKGDGPAAGAGAPNRPGADAGAPNGDGPVAGAGAPNRPVDDTPKGVDCCVLAPKIEEEAGAAGAPKVDEGKSESISDDGSCMPLPNMPPPPPPKVDVPKADAPGCVVALAVAPKGMGAAVAAPNALPDPNGVDDAAAAVLVLPKGLWKAPDDVCVADVDAAKGDSDADCANPVLALDGLPNSDVGADASTDDDAAPPKRLPKPVLVPSMRADADGVPKGDADGNGTGGADADAFWAEFAKNDPKGLVDGVDETGTAGSLLADSILCPAPKYRLGSDLGGILVLKLLNPPSRVFASRTADGFPSGPSSRFFITCFSMNVRCTENSSAWWFASMCPAPVRKASRTGAVSSGRETPPSVGNKSRKRESHLIPPSWPPNSACVGGLADMIKAIVEMMPCE
jgi:hypothetical protein